MCRRFNWREADRTKLTEQTKNAVIVLESLNAEDSLEEAVLELASLVERHCGAAVGKFII